MQDWTESHFKDSAEESLDKKEKWLSEHFNPHTRGKKMKKIFKGMNIQEITVFVLEILFLGFCIYNIFIAFCQYNTEEFIFWIIALFLQSKITYDYYKQHKE